MKNWGIANLGIWIKFPYSASNPSVPSFVLLDQPAGGSAPSHAHRPPITRHAGVDARSALA
jgi:hypothetical protein